MQINLNGTPHILSTPTSIAEFVNNLQIDPRKVAIEHNYKIVPLSEYRGTYINEGDVLEIVQFIGGG